MSDARPSVSVVVASGAGGDFLPRCLDSLREQATAHGAEVLVVDRCGGAIAERVRRDYPFVELVSAPASPRPGVPALRRLGAERATGDVVAVIEEHCVAPERWLDAIRDSFGPDDAALGGPILDRDFARLRDWVVYFSEYHNYLPPWPEGERYALNGANIAYRRDLLVRHRDVLDRGYWEVVLHPLLAADGRMRAVPGMGAYHSGPFDYAYYLEQRYLLSRLWGGTRRAQVSGAQRALYLAVAPLMPFLLLGRIALRVLQSGHRPGRFAAALPLLFPALCAYAWGEFLGYLVGPGDALERVE